MDLVTQRVKHLDCTIGTKRAIVSNIIRSDVLSKLERLSIAVDL